MVATPPPRFPPERMGGEIDVLGLLPDTALSQYLSDTSRWFRVVSGVGIDDLAVKIMKRWKSAPRVKAIPGEKGSSFSEGPMRLGVTPAQRRAWWKMLVQEAEQRGLTAEDLSLWTRRWLMSWAFSESAPAGMFYETMVELGSIVQRAIFGLILWRWLWSDPQIAEQARLEVYGRYDREDFMPGTDPVQICESVAASSFQIQSRMMEVIPRGAIDVDAIDDAIRSRMEYVFDSLSPFGGVGRMRRSLSDLDDGSLACAMSKAIGGVLPGLLNSWSVSMAGEPLLVNLVEAVRGARREFMDAYGVAEVAGPAGSPGWLDIQSASSGSVDRRYRRYRL